MPPQVEPGQQPPRRRFTRHTKTDRAYEVFSNLVGAQDARDREEERIADDIAAHGMGIINPFGGEEDKKSGDKQ